MSSSSSKVSILVTGATGTNGRDLAKVLASSYSSSASVSLLVRDIEKAKPTLGSFGSLVSGDFSDISSLDNAFNGIDSLFLLIPFVPNAVQLCKNAIEAAKRQKVKFILHLSSVGADSSSDVALLKDHGLQNEVIAASGIPYSIISPTFFMSNLINFNSSTLKSHGTFYGCTNESKYSSIDPLDTANVAAKILTSNDNDKKIYQGQNYILTDSIAYSDTQLAQMATEAWGVPIKYVDMPSSSYKSTLLSVGLPEIVVNDLVGLQVKIANGIIGATTNNVEKILGRKPNNFPNYLSTHKL